MAILLEAGGGDPPSGLSIRRLAVVCQEHADTTAVTRDRSLLVLVMPLPVTKYGKPSPRGIYFIAGAPRVDAVH